MTPSASPTASKPPALPRRVVAALDALPGADRKHMTHDLLVLMLLNLRHGSGEVMLTRAALAERIGTHPDNVSRIMATLVMLGVARRELGPPVGNPHARTATYFVNLRALTRSPLAKPRRSSVRRNP